MIQQDKQYGYGQTLTSGRGADDIKKQHAAE
jgi:hypothetical protein